MDMCIAILKVLESSRETFFDIMIDIEMLIYSKSLVSMPRYTDTLHFVDMCFKKNRRRNQSILFTEVHIGENYQGIFFFHFLL